ncbi:LacI family transcriptional regulator [Paenibacillus sp. CAA11]|uniref:LacI family DNA-binding transcriptional regulator n=1 Tax=Paenibacillus sp. CAA11 TaxID=1532905 RepID=UPI000D341A4A|nr:LacI family DNA-binding transcriptional regulator [Paenibacillus sp. CAA11]AWB43266.1 LacI family transcriptional regulator [Paenibacillus sp. CAA11]
MTGKRVTSLDVARRAGVSRSVVSAVINGTQGIGVSNEKRQAVLDAMMELNYHVDAQARAMKTGKSYCIAAFGDTSNALFLQMLEGAQRACAGHGYTVLLVGEASREEAREELIHLYLQRRIDGIISLDGPGYQNEAWAQRLLELDIPYISVEGYAENDHICSVLADYGDSVTAALNYLESRHEQVPIYLRMTADWPTDNWAERARLEAYLQYCQAKQAAPVVHTLPKEHVDAMESLLLAIHREQGTQIYLSNWVDGAIDLYRAAARLNLTIGQDLYVMSADNTYRISDHMVPRLSAMAVPYKAMGEQAVELLMAQIHGDGEPPDGASCWLKAELLPGESS